MAMAFATGLHFHLRLPGTLLRLPGTLLRLPSPRPRPSVATVCRPCAVLRSRRPHLPPVNALPTRDHRPLVAASLGAALLLVVLFEAREALALGPEGPLAEEFWENMRRYALYALTVSTGVAYAVLKPLYELLRNPISALLVVAIVVGGGFLLSQVLNLMVGIADFSYDYAP